jgi:ribosome-associated translation inhibitor RaiA
MQIQINTDHNIEGHQTLTIQVNRIVENALNRYSEHITHVDVHLSDENSNKKGGINNMRCMIEAHLKGRQPIAVTDQATTLDQAVEGASAKLANLIENTLDRLHDQELRRTDPALPEPDFTELS